MVKRFAWHLEAIESLRQSVLESENNIDANLPHQLEIILVEGKVRGVKRTIRYCQNCKVSWPCLVAQEDAIRRGQQKRQK